jgi:hypothetical protein
MDTSNKRRVPPNTMSPSGRERSRWSSCVGSSLHVPPRWRTRETKKARTRSLMVSKCFEKNTFAVKQDKRCCVWRRSSLTKCALSQTTARCSNAVILLKPTRVAERTDLRELPLPSHQRRREYTQCKYERTVTKSRTEKHKNPSEVTAHQVFDQYIRIQTGQEVLCLEEEEFIDKMCSLMTY